MKPTDLRGILRYVPDFRDRVFVINIDAAVIDSPNFGNLIQDIAVLRSLNIRIAISHGVSTELRRHAATFGIELSDYDGSGVTDEPTLRAAIQSSYQLSHKLLEGLSARDLPAEMGNGALAHPRGIIQGVDHQWTGEIERFDVARVRTLMNSEIIPVFPPLGFDGEGRTFRVNSDGLAAELAGSLGAAKILFLTEREGIYHRGELIREILPDKLEGLLQNNELDATSVSKAASAILAIEKGVPRAHIINGIIDERLLQELFSNEGVGSLVYDNQYKRMRRATLGDAPRISALTQKSMERAELVARSESIIENSYQDFFLYELDGNLVGCVALHLGDGAMAELACLCVSPGHENLGIGRRLIEYVKQVARDQGASRLFALSTRAYAYLETKGGFEQGRPDDLPENRRSEYLESNRRSRILVCQL